MAKKITWVSRFALALPPAQPFNSFKPVALLLLTMMLFIPSPSEANSYTYTSNITTYAGKGKKAKGNQVEQLSIDFNTVGPLTTGNPTISIQHVIRGLHISLFGSDDCPRGGGNLRHRSSDTITFELDVQGSNRNPNTTKQHSNQPATETVYHNAESCIRPRLSC